MKNLIAEGRKLQEKFMTESRIDELDMNKVDWQKVKVTYTGKDGKQHRIQLHSALTYDKKHPAYKAGMEMYNRMKKKGEAGTKPSLSTKVNKKKSGQPNIFAQKPEEAPKKTASDDNIKAAGNVIRDMMRVYNEDPKVRQLTFVSEHAVDAESAYRIAVEAIGNYNEFEPIAIRNIGDGKFRLGRERSPVVYYTPTEDDLLFVERDPAYWNRIKHNVHADEVDVYTEENIKKELDELNGYLRELEAYADKTKYAHSINEIKLQIQVLQSIRPGEVRFWWD